MPKRVDHAAQRQAIAAAAIEIIDASGLDGARLRDVAKAADVTTGAVTHYFDGKDAVLEAALSEIVERLLSRQPGSETGAAAMGLVEAACAFLPLDEAGRRDWRVWLAFWGRAIVDDRLRALHARYYAEIVGRLAEALQSRRPGIAAKQAEALADALVAAVDGVGTRATLEPETWPPERQRRTLALLIEPLFAADRRPEP